MLFKSIEKLLARSAFALIATAYVISMAQFAGLA